jgi:hypothetical protein
VQKVITVRDAYLQAAASAAELIGRPAVAAAWNDASALREFRVSGLAGHLAHQVLTVPAVLGNDVPEGSMIELLDHYSSVTWRTAGVDDEINVGIRTQGESHATDGPAAWRRSLPSWPPCCPRNPATGSSSCRGVRGRCGSTTS